MHTLLLGLSSFLSFSAFILSIVCVVMWNTYDKLDYLVYSTLAALGLSFVLFVAGLLLNDAKHKKT